ncbi:MAG: hypothetical protein HY433_00695, partial [Candidatus Liptonbacteria bacterium]|nr:hypothetical protein [Candidatus Liptonbacteria bacterium]
MFFKRLVPILVLVLSASFLIPAFASAQTTSVFHDGDRVQSTVNLNVRQSPSTGGVILGSVPVGTQGTISCNLAGSTACPTTANGYTWWYIDWDGSIPNGWSAEGSSEVDFLTKVASPQSFIDGDRVQATPGLKIRSTPGTSGTVLGNTSAGSVGTVRCNLAGSTACPTTANGYTWWYIDWDGSLPTGWSAEGSSEAPFLEKIVTSGAGTLIWQIKKDGVLQSGSSVVVNANTPDGQSVNLTVPAGTYNGMSVG